MKICECAKIVWTMTPWGAAIVDAKDGDLLCLNWTVQTRGNPPVPACLTRRIDRRTVRIHRLIAGAGDDQIVDHVNGDPLDNRLENLRLANTDENNRNRRRQRTAYSGLKGVENLKPGLWRASITVGGRKHHLGCYPTAEEAADAYDNAAVAMHGEFAKTNRIAGMAQRKNSPNSRVELGAHRFLSNKRTKKCILSNENNGGR